MRKPTSQHPLLRFIDNAEDAIVVTLFAAIVLIALSQIVLRNFFHTGFSWATPMLGVLLLWLTLSGAVVAARRNQHIAINILSRRLSPFTERIVHTVAKIFTASVCAVIAYYGAQLVQMDLESATMLFAEVPAWASELIIPISFSLLAVRYFIAAIEEVATLKRR